MAFYVPVVYLPPITQSVSVSEPDSFQALAPETGFSISQTSGPVVVLASSTLTSKLSGTPYPAISGVTVNDTTGNQITVTITSAQGIKLNSNTWNSAGGGGTASNPFKWTYTGTLSQVNTALKNINVNVPSSGTFTVTITANNGQASSTPVTLTLQVN